MAVHDSKAMATKDIPRILHARDSSSTSNSLIYNGERPAKRALSTQNNRFLPQSATVQGYPIATGFVLHVGSSSPFPLSSDPHDLR